MQNPFDLILQKLDALESKINSNNSLAEVVPVEIIGRDELCNRLNITEPTCIRWERKGVIPSFRIGNSVRYNWPKVVECLEKKKAR